MTTAVETESTLDVVRQLIVDYDASRERTLQTDLGPSDLGSPCARQMAMKLAGIPERVEWTVPWGPIQGTAIHGLMEQVLAMDNARHIELTGSPRWLIEERVQIDDAVRGTSDAYDLITDTVIDWKYVGVTSLKKAGRHTIPAPKRISQGYRVQLHLYGLGHQRAGRTPKRVQVIFLARGHDFDASVEWTEPYREDVALWALDRYYRIREQVAVRDMAAHPELLAEVPTAATEDACKYCSFRRAGAPTDGTGCPGITE